MKLQTTLFTLILIILCSVSARPVPVSITEYNSEPDSIDQFAVDVLTMAYQKEYWKLEPYFSRTWKEWSPNRDPESAWRNVSRASELSEIYLLPPEKSTVHRDVYYIRYYVIKPDGKRSGSELIVMDENGFKLAVQANRSPVGNDYVRLGDRNEYVIKKLEKLGAEFEKRSENTLISRMPDGHTFRLSFSGSTSELEKLELIDGVNSKDLYLAIFDLEGTPTIKLRTGKAKPKQSSAMKAPQVSSPEEFKRKAQEKAILNNLRILASAADQYYLENGVLNVNIDQLLGPSGYIKKLNAVDGEDYSKLDLSSNTKEWKVISASGITVTYSR